MTYRAMRATCAAILGLGVAFGALAQDGLGKKAGKKKDMAPKAIQVPAGLVAETVASEPNLANPVAFCFDEKGAIYVAEAFRLHKGVTDNRGHMKWLDDELASRTVADRVAMFQKHKYNAAGTSDRVRRLEASQPGGPYDKDTVFADGFDKAEDGLGSGVLAWRGNVYYACIPHLWLLKAGAEPGKAATKKALQSGYGVHVAFIGHDSHGLKMGPDGRLYFTIGDRGLHVETEGRVVSAPDCGALLRCEPDGSGLEIVHTGLRNPQEIAFDQHGNWFTVDNNADGGDQARLVHLVEGGDSGWRLGYQYLPVSGYDGMTRLGIWNQEKIWQPHNPHRGAAYLPPLKNITNGPSGLTYHPGVAQLPDSLKGRFFVCDFRGGAGGSGVHTFTVKPHGASFALDKFEQFVWSVLATDCDFGPDGGFYVSDWIDGWGLTGKGRIHRFADPSKAEDPLVHDVRKRLAEGTDKLSVAELIATLGHADQRVRLEAQYTLAERGAKAELAKAAAGPGPLLARLHAVWGLGQIGRKTPESLRPVVALLGDAEAEVRASAAKVLGEAQCRFAAADVGKALQDASPRVRFEAATAAGRLGVPPAALLDLLRTTVDDPYLRHAAVHGLATAGDVAALNAAIGDPSPQVRLGVLLALRRLARPEVARFLNDVDPMLVLEAARAIGDTPIPQALPELATLTERSLPETKEFTSAHRDFAMRRAIAARYRLGRPEDAAALTAFAGKKNITEAVRVEAVRHLRNWEKPSGRDVVVGLWRPFAAHAGKDVATAVRASLAKLTTSGNDVRNESAKLAAAHGIREIAPALRAVVSDATLPAATRVDTLAALESLKDPQLAELAEKALSDVDGRVRHQARRIASAKASPAELAARFGKALDSGDVAEKQGALDVLGKAKSPEADALVLRSLEALVAGKAAPEIALDVIEAGEARKSRPEIAKLLARLEGARGKEPVAPFRETLRGGDAEAGRRVFFEKAELSCLRCHKLQGTGGEVGPDLAGIGKRVDRAYLLESLVDPNKQIAKGFETVVLVLTNGQVKSGILKSEDAKEVRLVTAEGQMLAIPKSQIEERNRGPSAMPADLAPKMTRREIRDLVEFLAGQ